MATKRARADSTSTMADQDINSVFSDNAAMFTSTRTTPLGTLGEKAPNVDEVEEIDKQTFESNIRQKRADSFLDDTNNSVPSSPEGTTINGSTLSGIDPLHRLLQEQDIEPTFWQQCREEAQLYGSPPKKRSRRSPPDPKHFDTLPLSSEAYDRGMTSGFDIMLEPVSGEVFWATLKARWDLSMRYETVAERREELEMCPFFSEPTTPMKSDEGFVEEKYRGELMVEA